MLLQLNYNTFSELVYFNFVINLGTPKGNVRIFTVNYRLHLILSFFSNVEQIAKGPCVFILRP